MPSFPNLLHAFLSDQLSSSNSEGHIDLDEDEDLLEGISPISVYHLAVTSFYAPSDPSSICGMCCEQIRSTPSWWSAGPHHDYVFVVKKQNEHGFQGMSVIHIKLFFSFRYEGEEYPCALIEWFKKDSRSPNEQTGMWVVKPEEDCHGERLMTVVHLDTILQGAHLIPIYSSSFIPPHFCHTWSLDAFM